MHFTATPRIPHTSRRTQENQFQRRDGVEPHDFTADLAPRLRTLLNPMNPDNARILRITAAAGTELADAFLRVPSTGTSPAFVPGKEVCDALRLPPSRGLAGSAFRPLTNIPHCCLP